MTKWIFVTGGVASSLGKGVSGASVGKLLQLNGFSAAMAKFDPYFNNPIVEKFKKEYEKNFDKKRCYLDNFKINKLIEISVDNPDFVEKLPEIIKKFSKLKFTNAPATLKWLINEGGWAGILNGEYDSFVKNEDSQNDGFDLGIPVWSDD